MARIRCSAVFNGRISAARANRAYLRNIDAVVYRKKRRRTWTNWLAYEPLNDKNVVNEHNHRSIRDGQWCVY